MHSDPETAEMNAVKEIPTAPPCSVRLIMINPTGEPQGKLDEQLQRLGFSIVHVQQGPGALEEVGLLAATAGAVILDWRSEGGKDGHFAEALARTAAEFDLRVLTLAASSRAEDLGIASKAGLAEGLCAPCQLADLKGALTAVLHKSHRLTANIGFSLEAAMPLLESCKFRFRTPEDVEKLVPLIARTFPQPRRAAAGITELMMNAIEHGNLEIGQERKSDWIARGVYRAELLKRLNTPPFSDRWGEVIITRRQDGVMIVIMDQGCGFCWQDFVQNPPAKNGMTVESSGHGIAIAKQESFDDLRFNHQGNQVTAFVSKESLGW